MKKKLVALLICMVLCVMTIQSSLAATLSATVTGKCKTSFTPSYYLQKSSSDNDWAYMREHCTLLEYVEGNGAYMDFYLKSYNSNGGAAAPDTLCEYGDTYINFYTGQKATTKVTFKVYNSHYYEDGDNSTRVSIRSTVYGTLEV